MKATDGVYIRPSEAIQLSAAAGETLKVFVLACPLGEISGWTHMPANFDAACPERVVSVDPEQRTAMGPRYFQILVDKRIGSNVITQFIGHIPPSKAAAASPSVRGGDHRAERRRVHVDGRQKGARRAPGT